MDMSELQCTITLEILTGVGTVSKRTVHRNSKIILGRNEFRDIILKMELGKVSAKYRIQEMKLHKRFVKDGKATLHLPDHKVQIMLANCPPDQLIRFLKCLVTKLEINKSAGTLSERQRMRSELPRTFDNISPLTQKDFNTVSNIRNQQADAKGTETTPSAASKRKGLKRGRIEMSDETNKIESAPKKRLSVSSVPMRLSQEQCEVLKAVLDGQNVFFTGSAGTGKSFLLKRIIGALPPDATFATASTGVAACHINGITLHQFAGMGSGSQPLEPCIELASRPARARQWRKCKHLIVDEISMLDADFFTKLEHVARVVRNKDKPFGGIQVILCGDFLQLPPVTKAGQKRQFCFQSPAWWKCIHKTMELRQVRRQTDTDFINILQHIRVGRCPDEMAEKLAATAANKIDKNGILATRLCTHKEDVEQINVVQLQKLPDDSNSFEAIDSDPGLVKLINNQCTVKQTITLKKGAQVMLTKNLDVGRGMVNGARGVITGFAKEKGLPIVRFLNGLEQTIGPEKWPIKLGGGACLMRRQLPLQLAWAISIHKSQGLSLDCVEMSLSRVFECGQAYVALSRARNLEGLRVVDFEKSCVRASSDVLKFYQKLRLEARMMSQSIDCYGNRYNNKENYAPL
ncbi:ATP-dependent DNA helicase PIF1-like [Ptychodera flava]|uniref:ATP-dependent DNA helicase PIF1-like n=1 Tax=Ptychodera flava TaxID=63121 RepID=UPI00396A3076